MVLSFGVTSGMAWPKRRVFHHNHPAKSVPAIATMLNATSENIKPMTKSALLRQNASSLLYQA
ncbi:MAG: hypothetical protein D3M94_14520 [Rhodocyclales bacterium GT-UBC]|nr:MAG: hypothetical protein D3M94_14520 [Rhodocyclales bacterium GT-UBC]